MLTWNEQAVIWLNSENAFSSGCGDKTGRVAGSSSPALRQYSRRALLNLEVQIQNA